ncbi:MAG: ribonuclease D [Hyphomicrobium sp.]|nr:ribonuclease D [Hyphomicrobium sp.]
MRCITTTDELAVFCRDLANQDFVTVDTEFMREQTFWPELCLIQIAADGQEAIVDPMAGRIDLGPFYELMANDRVTKVFHAARQDIEIIYSGARLVPNPIFDTQVAASVCGFGDSVSYVNLVREITGQDLDKSSRFTDWSRRPLSEKQLVYALGDVTHLRDVYRHLKSELEKFNRESWLDEEMAELKNPSTYLTHPEDAWKRLKMRVRNRKSFAVLIELAAWRERVAQSSNVPRNRVLRDEALYDIANQMPTSTEQLAGLRTLSDGFSRSARAREIIEAVNRGLERDPKALPAQSNARPVSAEAGATVELLKVLLKSAAARHRVAPRMIADTEDLERIAAEHEPDVLALRGWRRDLFGEDALRLKRGELALSLSGGEVIVLPAKSPAKVPA